MKKEWVCRVGGHLYWKFKKKGKQVTTIGCCRPVTTQRRNREVPRKNDYIFPRKEKGRTGVGSSGIWSRACQPKKSTEKPGALNENPERKKNSTKYQFGTGKK